MSIVVLGAGGLLGGVIVEELRRQGKPVRGFARAECDITRASEVRDRVGAAALVINCAAFTNVDAAETDEATAYAINAGGTENVARAAAAAGAALVHVSTDFVFDGRQAAPYDEAARPNPLSAYARSKFAGEEAARALIKRLFVVRVQGLYGAGGRNFASRLRELILAQKPLKLDGERRVQPTSARVAARQIATIADAGRHGTFHVSCAGATTWAEFAARMASRLGVGRSWDVVDTAALGAPAPRPVNCLFAHRWQMPSWETAQDEYLAEAGT